MPQLRTKTGCLTCRKRRKKCDERAPTCQRCTVSHRECLWPAAGERKDRRHLTRQQRQDLNISDAGIETSDTGSDLGESIDLVPLFRSHSAPEFSTANPHISFVSENATQEVMLREVEQLCSRHFVDLYFGQLLLPGCHPAFYHGWIDEIQQLMEQYKSLYYSVLACSASHIHGLSKSPYMQELALDFYGKSVNNVGQLLAVSHVATHNGLLMSIILLYIHGCLGLHTFTDVPRHVEAAIKLVKIRLLNSPNLTLRTPFERIAVESVLYQVFLITMGSWTTPRLYDFDFDPNFWSRAERLLAQSKLFPEQPDYLNSPVLGIPVRLFRLVLSVTQLYRSESPADGDTIEQIRLEVGEWEAVILQEQNIDLDTDDSEPRFEMYKSTAYLYILIASALLDQAIDTMAQQNVTAVPKSIHSWQADRMVQILERHKHDLEWPKCFMAVWPTYTVGFFVASLSGVDLIRHELDRRMTATGSTQIQRYRDDLEWAWRARGIAIDDNLR